MRNKNDYFHEVDDLRAPAGLRSRIAALEVKKSRGTAYKAARRLAIAACLVLAAAAVALLLFNRTGGELHPGPTPTPSPTQTQPPIPDEELAQLLANAYAAAQAAAIQEGEQWYLLSSYSQNGRTMGVLRYEAAIHAGGYGNLVLGVFDSASRALVGNLQILRGDVGDAYSWTDDGDGQFYTVCTNFYQGQGWQACTAALFVLQDSGLEPVRALPGEDSALFDLDTQDYDDFWSDRKGVIRVESGLVGLDLYTRDSDPQRQQSGDDAWNFERYLPLGTARAAAEDPDPSAAFARYSAPLLPLTCISDREAADVFTVDRQITIDFNDLLYPDRGDSPLYPRVTEHYVIHNNSDEDRYNVFYYPLPGTLFTAEPGVFPTITADGSPVTPSVTPGATVVLTGTPHNEYGALADWGAYDSVLTEDLDYLNRSLSGYDDTVRDLPLTVYDVTDIQGGDNARDGWSATLAVEFTLSDPKAQVFTYGFDGQEALDSENGRWRYSFFCNGNAAGLHRLIVIGGTIQNAALTGYQDGTCTEAVPGFTGGLTGGWETYFWAEAMADVMTDYYREDPAVPLYTEVNLYRTAADLIWNTLYAYRPDSPAPADELFADWARLESIFSAAAGQQRIFYYEYAATVPAHGTLELEISRYYAASCSESSSVPRCGCDLAMTLGSALNFTSAQLNIRTPDCYMLFNGNLSLGTSDLSFSQERYYFAVDPGPVVP